MIAIIVAVSKNGVIGKGGNIPWKIKGEQKRFKELTVDNIVIMGRKTFEDIGHPLPNRKNFILSRNKEYVGKDIMSFKTLQDALKFAGDRDVYIAGGGKVYEEALELADVLYITEIDIEIEGDVYFPKISKDNYIEEYRERIEGDVPYTYFTYRRKNDYTRVE